MGLLSFLFGGKDVVPQQLQLHPEGEPALIIARHEVNRAVVTETLHEAARCEVGMSEPSGAFELNPPAGSRGTHTETHLLVSRPGFATYEKRYRWDTGRSGREITLTATSDYGQEAVAVQRLEVRANELELDADDQRTVDEHIATRQAYLLETYPTEVEELEERRNRRLARRRPGVGSRILDLAALPDERLALLTPRDGGRVLVIVDRDEAVVSEALLAGAPMAVGLARDGESLFALDGDALRRFDLAGAPLEQVVLEPAPTAAERVTGLAVGEDEILVGLEASSRIRRYSRAGKLLAERKLPSVAQLGRIFRAPDGAILVQGRFAGHFDYDLQVMGMKKVDGLPKGIMRLADPAADPEVVLAGVDSATVGNDGMVAYAADLYPAEDHELVKSGLAGTTHQLVVFLDWEGTVKAARDVSDSALQAAELGQPFGDRLVFFAWDRVLEVDAAAALPVSLP